jgi:hypothetical protein
MEHPLLAAPGTPSFAQPGQRLFSSFFRARVTPFPRICDELAMKSRLVCSNVMNDLIQQFRLHEIMTLTNMQPSSSVHRPDEPDVRAPRGIQASGRIRLRRREHATLPSGPSDNTGELWHIQETKALFLERISRACHDQDVISQGSDGVVSIGPESLQTRQGLVVVLL